MEKISLAFILVFTSLAGTFGQTSKTITLKAGESFADVAASPRSYYYPDFVEGKVFFKDGSFNKARLNYNWLVRTVQFINPHNDTLSIANENNISLIAINNDTFYYNNGYLKQIAANQKIKLASQTYMKLLDKQKIGAYGLPSNGTIESYSSLVTGRQQKDLMVREDLVLARELFFFMGDHNNRFLPFNKKNLLKTYPEKQQEIETYLKENRVDFKSQQDLEKLLAFLQKW